MFVDHRLSSTVFKLHTRPEGTQQMYAAEAMINLQKNKQNKTKQTPWPGSRANYTDQATVTCRRSLCQRLMIEGATWSA
jgi:hypothetical protein